VVDNLSAIGAGASFSDMLKEMLREMMSEITYPIKAVTSLNDLAQVMIEEWLTVLPVIDGQMY
jgi:predicted transcriptional regulator